MPILPQAERGRTVLNWNAFAQLPGAADRNFEKLCRALIRRHYGQFGEFKELANQAGVEFHLRLLQACDLGEPGRWHGWQCKWYELAPGKRLGSTRQKDIEESLEKTRAHLPELTDWTLWTRHVLPKADQVWFYALGDRFTGVRLDLKTADDVEDLLCGPAALLRETYFGELVFTAQALDAQQRYAAAPFQHRFQPEVHHAAPVEQLLGEYLGRATSWAALSVLSERLRRSGQGVRASQTGLAQPLQSDVDALLAHAQHTAVRLDRAYGALGDGNLEILQQLLADDFGPLKPYTRLLGRLRTARSPCSIDGTNLVADLHAAKDGLQELKDAIESRLVAVLAPAGNGKSELAVSLTSRAGNHAAGVLFLGRDLHSRQSLDQLASSVQIGGRSVQNFERLVEALDAAGHRLGQRLPIVIDGLNESEDPRDWKNELSRATVRLARHPYVLMVVTLREEFDDDCLPEDVEKLELNGFGAEPQLAIDKYFAHYKIDASDADLPLEMLQHPLTLRIYCDVANRSRESWVGVESLPRSLTALFEEYLSQVARRVAELSPKARRVHAGEVERALLAMAGMLWGGNARSVEYEQARIGMGDAGTWDQSMLRALESEGVLLRVRDDAGMGVAFAYDLMAGHLIARHLLQQHTGDGWLQDPDNLGRLVSRSQTAHPLAYDIFRAVVGLYPKLRRRRPPIWQLLPTPLKARILRMSVEADPQDIDAPTVQAFREAMLNSTDFAMTAYPLLRVTRAARGHPFDVGFLDGVLRSMRNTERDLSWSEWVRGSHEEVVRDVQAMEQRWNSGTVGAQEMLRGRWLMWTLTTTSRDLRDMSTRALHVLAMKMPSEFCALVVESLTISDPYVPERMLAAAYGAALSTWEDARDGGMRGALPGAAVALFQAAFAQGASTPTRHTLARQYALGIIDLARRVDPACLTLVDQARLAPPYAHLPSPFADQSAIPATQIEAADDEAIKTDFGNYTIGRLVDDRGNYDFKHADYVAVRRAIVARMVELGYDPACFEKADRHMRTGFREDRESKIDRYGKKYGWIAFFEMWGWREDQGLLPSWRRGERPADADIDPTFPGPGETLACVLPDLFDGAPTEMEHWTFSGPTPDYSSLHTQDSLGEHRGPWVLLGGYISENDPSDRHAFTFLRGMFVKKRSVEYLLARFDETAYPGNSTIPNEPERCYTFAGEMPFAETLGITAAPEQEEEDDVFVLPSEPPRCMGVAVEIPVQDYCWESYHSRMNPHHGMVLPSTALCSALKLHVRAGTWDLFDADGVASAFRKVGMEGSRIHGHLAYLRADLLERYLQSTGQALVWLAWGERGRHHRAYKDRVPGSDRDWQPLYAASKHVHKRSAVWSPGSQPVPTPSEKAPRAAKAGATQTTGRRAASARKARP